MRSYGIGFRYIHSQISPTSTHHRTKSANFANTANPSKRRRTRDLPASGRSRPPRQGQPAICRGRAVDRPNRQSPAGSAALVRPLEQCLHALPRLGKGGYLEAAVRRRLRRSRHGICHGRCHHRQGPPPRTGRKRGTQSQAIGRSKGGMTTKILEISGLGEAVKLRCQVGAVVRHGTHLDCVVEGGPQCHAPLHAGL